MASPHQPHQPPINPFDGFDVYASVAAPSTEEVSASGYSNVPVYSPSATAAPPENEMKQQQQQNHYLSMPTNQQWPQPLNNPNAKFLEESMTLNPFNSAAQTNSTNPNRNSAALVASSTPSNPYSLDPFAVMNLQQPHLMHGLPPNAMPGPAWMASPSAGLNNSMPSPVVFSSEAERQQLVTASPSDDPFGIFGSIPHQSTSEITLQHPFQQVQPVPHNGHTALSVNSFATSNSNSCEGLPERQIVTAPPADDPFGAFLSPTKPSSPSTISQHLIEQQVQQLRFNVKNEVLPNDDDEEGLALVDVELEDEEGDKNLEEHKNDGEFIGRTTINKTPKNRDKNADIAPPPPPTPGRKNAEFLSQNTGGLTSPLPIQSLVKHSGYVLSRISFRTVLMRKWKQTFWIQYGPTQLLFFRSFADYEDWLNNPYHSVKAREFLVKLRVDFVSDLKKKSVMGYQVTQIRRKPYGQNVMLHFKLERWMDYGPTIAAAFAARQEEMIQNPYYSKKDVSSVDVDDDGMNSTNDVSALRKIILGCMRNARDASVVASQRERLVQHHVGHEDTEYQGRYATDDSIHLHNASAGGLYYQAHSAESSTRRKSPIATNYQGTESSSSKKNSDFKEDRGVPNTAASQTIDLLG